MITVNGIPSTTAATTVAELVAVLGFVRGTVLVELNGVALRPDEWPRALQSGDVVELLRIVAGG